MNVIILCGGMMICFDMANPLGPERIISGQSPPDPKEGLVTVLGSFWEILRVKIQYNYGLDPKKNLQKKILQNSFKKLALKH